MNVIEQLSLVGLVPVIKVEDANDAVPLCKALSDGGLPVARSHPRLSRFARALVGVARGEVAPERGGVEPLGEEALEEFAEDLHELLDRPVDEPSAGNLLELVVGELDVLVGEDVHDLLRVGACAELVDQFVLVGSGYCFSFVGAGFTRVAFTSLSLMQEQTRFVPKTARNALEWLAGPASGGGLRRPSCFSVGAYRPLVPSAILV